MDVYFATQVLTKMDQMIALLEQSNSKLDQLIEIGGNMSVQLDNLTAKVEEAVTVEEAAVAKIQELLASVQSLSAELMLYKDDPAKIQELADMLSAQTSLLAGVLAPPQA